MSASDVFRPYRVVAADPSWAFGDHLTMSEVPRGAASNYAVMTTDDVAALPVGECMAEDAVCVLWRPSSMAEDGARVMRAWGFRPVGEWVWSKRPAPPTPAEVQAIVTEAMAEGVGAKELAARISRRIGKLHFGLGRLARAAKEVAAVGVRGSPYRHLRDRATRDVFEAPALAYSVKTEVVQDALERMFPDGPYLELFARRARTRWFCAGNESPATLGQDLRDVVPALARKIARTRAAGALLGVP